MADRKSDTAADTAVDLSKLNADAAAEALKAGRQSNGGKRAGGRLADAKPTS